MTSAPVKLSVGISRHIEKIRELSEDIKVSIVAIAVEFKGISEKLGGSPQAIDALHAEMPGVGLGFWRNIAHVAENRLHPVAISSGCTAIKCLTSMPIEEQEKALTVGVPVAIAGGDHRLVPAHLLSSREIKQAIADDGHIRSVSEQLKYERDQREKADQMHAKYVASLREVDAEIPDETESKVRWRVIGRNKVQINSVPLTVTENDLLAILKEMRHDK